MAVRDDAGRRPRGRPSPAVAHVARRPAHAHRGHRGAPPRRLGTGLAAVLAAVFVASGLRLIAGAGGTLAMDRPGGSTAARAARPPLAPESALGRVSGAAEPSVDDDRAPALPASPSAVSVPACRYADEPAPHAGVDEWASTIVDTI